MKPTTQGEEPGHSSNMRIQKHNYIESNLTFSMLFPATHMKANCDSVF
jgi:hypothetical protein